MVQGSTIFFLHQMQMQTAPCFVYLQLFNTRSRLRSSHTYNTPARFSECACQSARTIQPPVTPRGVRDNNKHAPASVTAAVRRSIQRPDLSLHRITLPVAQTISTRSTVSPCVREVLEKSPTPQCRMSPISDVATHETRKISRTYEDVEYYGNPPLAFFPSVSSQSQHPSPHDTEVRLAGQQRQTVAASAGVDCLLEVVSIAYANGWLGPPAPSSIQLLQFFFRASARKIPRDIMCT